MLWIYSITVVDILQYVVKTAYRLQNDYRIDYGIYYRIDQGIDYGIDYRIDYGIDHRINYGIDYVIDY